MTKKDFLLSLLSQVQHPEDPTNDIFLGLEYLVSQNDVTDEVLDAVEKILVIIMKTTKDLASKDKYTQAQSLIAKIKALDAAEHNSDFDAELEAQILALGQ